MSCRSMLPILVLGCSSNELVPPIVPEQDVEETRPSITTLFQIGASGRADIDVIAIANDGDIVVGGQLLALNEGSAHVARYAANGAFRWGHALETSNAYTHQIAALAIAPDGDIIVCGEIHNQELNDQIVVERLTAEGDSRWRHTFGGESYDSCGGVALDSAGHTLVAGTTTRLFIANISPEGNVIYALVRGPYFLSPSGGDSVGAVLVDEDRFYVTGAFSKANLGGGALEEFGGDSDGFLAAYDVQTGDFLWAQSFGSARFRSADRGTALMMVNENTFALGGSVGTEAYFAGTTINNDGPTNALVALIDRDGAVISAVAIQQEGLGVVRGLGWRNDGPVALVAENSDTLSVVSFDQTSGEIATHALLVDWGLSVDAATAQHDGTIAVALRFYGEAEIDGTAYQTAGTNDYLVGVFPAP